MTVEGTAAELARSRALDVTNNPTLLVQTPADPVTISSPASYIEPTIASSSDCTTTVRTTVVTRRRR
ncbi:hypothetical protein ARTHRO9V_1030001 [Arthrobacter sp. 9V]|uniref:hypothetical protein n=1 Tax=Arthrobacter sp. 9V TaxID=2653132 RepID=UPI0012F3F5E4|nr:hypothetical protein [Arthrobacter sp. 9V]VXB12904.1 hypothetical protein ARTHRO9V_1030001 [Arthrobacter sp. 9V]